MFSGAVNKYATCLTSLKAAAKSFLGLIASCVVVRLSFIKLRGSVKAPFLQRYGYGFMTILNQPKTQLPLREASLHPALLPPFCQCEHSSSHAVSWMRERVHLEANPNTRTQSQKNLPIFTWISNLIHPLKALALAEGAGGLDGPWRVRMK